MKSFQKVFCILLVGFVGFGAVATTISDVTARTSNGKVDIGYTITGGGYGTGCLFVGERIGLWPRRRMSDTADVETVSRDDRTFFRRDHIGGSDKRCGRQRIRHLRSL